MNPDQPSREQIETRITALLLGELPADEAALLRYTISQDPALKKLHDQIESALPLVREAARQPGEAPLEKPAPIKMSADRREKLLAHFKTARTKQEQPAPKDPLFWLKRIKSPRFVEVLVVIAILAMLAAMLLPALSRSKSKAQFGGRFSFSEVASDTLGPERSSVSTTTDSEIARQAAQTALAQAEQRQIVESLHGFASTNGVIYYAYGAIPAEANKPLPPSGTPLPIARKEEVEARLQEMAQTAATQPASQAQLPAAGANGQPDKFVFSPGPEATPAPTPIALPAEQPEAGQLANDHGTHVAGTIALGTRSAGGVISADEIAGHVIAPKNSHVYSQNVVGYSGIPTGIQPTPVNDGSPASADGSAHYTFGMLPAEASAPPPPPVAAKPEGDVASLSFSAGKFNEEPESAFASAVRRLQTATKNTPPPASTGEFSLYSAAPQMVTTASEPPTPATPSTQIVLPQTEPELNTGPAVAASDTDKLAVQTADSEAVLRQADAVTERAKQSLNKGRNPDQEIVNGVALNYATSAGGIGGGGGGGGFGGRVMGGSSGVDRNGVTGLPPTQNSPQAAPAQTFSVPTTTTFALDDAGVDGLRAQNSTYGPPGLSPATVNPIGAFPGVATPPAASEAASESTKSESPERRFESAVTARGTGTVAGNRFYRNPTSESDDKKVPMVGDIPVMGRLFQSSTPASIPAPAQPAAPINAGNFAQGPLYYRTVKSATNGGSQQKEVEVSAQPPAPVATLKMNNSDSEQTALVLQNMFQGNNTRSTQNSPLQDRSQSQSVMSPTTADSFAIGSGTSQEVVQAPRGMKQGLATLSTQSSTAATKTDPEWAGVLDHPNMANASNNHFISRYPFVASTNYINPDAFNPGVSAVVPNSDTETLSVNDALHRYGELTGRSVLTGALPPSGEIVLPKSMSKDDETKALQEALAMNDLSMVNIGDKFAKALPSNQAGSAGGEIDRDLSATAPTPTFDSQQLQMINSQMIEKEKIYNEQLTQLQKLKSLQTNNPDQLRDVLPQMVPDTKLNELLAQLHEARQDMVTVTNDFGVQGTSPKAQTHLDELNGEINDRITGIMASLDSQVDSKKAALDAMTAKVEATKEKDQEEAIKNQPYYTAKIELDQKEKMHQLLYSKLEAEKIDLNLPKTSMVQITDPAEPGKSQTMWQRLTGQYESTARIKIENDVTDIPNMEGNPNAEYASYDPYFIQTTFEIMQSQAVLGKVVDALNLQTTWAKNNGGQKLSKNEAMEILKQRLELQPVKNTKLVSISAKDSDPQESAKIANAVAEAYSQYRIEYRRALTTNGVAVLEQQFENQAHDLQLAQAKVDNLGKELNVQGNVSTPAEYISEVIPIRYAKVDDVASALQNLQSAGQTKIIPNENSGSLLVYATRDDLETIKENIAKLDTNQTDLPLRQPAPNTPVPQPEILTSSNAFSTFAMNVSDVSFKFAEASLQNGKLPDTASIRSEEFVNAFDYRDPEAAAGQPMAFTSEQALYPFAHNRELLRFSVKAAAAGRQEGRPLNLVLLLDTSGSMERADRVEIVREALHVLSTQLHENDVVSVVSFARTARLWADGVPGDKAGATLDQVGGITPEGGTNLEEAMRLAYETAQRHYLANGMNRVVLLTDGAANLGNVDPAALEAKVETQRKQGIALDCFGIGWEDLNDDLLEELSSHGDGRYAFLNSPEDATKDFAAKLAGALRVAAQDLKVQVEFNPQRVTTYRQIGYAKHQLTKEQFRDNTVAAGEIASQEAGNALYTIQVNPDGEGPIATVHVRYRLPGTQDYHEHSWDVEYTGHTPALDQSSPAMRLAATASAFSEWLAASPFAQEVTPDALLNYLSGVPEVYGADDRPKQLETMIREAKSLEGK